MPKLSVIVPVYNEEGTIRQIIEKIENAAIDKEIILVDDSSTDGTGKILRDMRHNNLKVIHHSSNRGKGASVLTGLDNATGEFVIIQDADLEYDPQDYLGLMEVASCYTGVLVLGARFNQGHKGLFIHRLGNKFLSWMLNVIFASHLNDYATCYKLARREVFNELKLKATGFDIDVEIVCNAIKRGIKIIEVPVNYYPRTYKEGKKIRLKDAMWAVFYMFKYRFSK